MDSVLSPLDDVTLMKDSDKDRASGNVSRLLVYINSHTLSK